MTNSSTQICVVIGASHAGVNFAFSLRKEGWEGSIILFDKQTAIPYHRPPLSKTYLTSGDDAKDKNVLKSHESYTKENITLQLGVSVKTIHREAKKITLSDGTLQQYDKLVIATGARPLIPDIKGINNAINIFTLRTIKDSEAIRNAIKKGGIKSALIIGGGYIGLEIAASLKKMDISVTVLERENRILDRVTTQNLSTFFKDLHTNNGVVIDTKKNVISIETHDNVNTVICDDGTRYNSDMIVLGVGIRVNTELAQEAGIAIENGIKVSAASQTSDKAIYAIGDCTYHHNPHYNRFVRLESVQNAIDQAKVAAASICGKMAIYDAIPWFWSDQYDVKLQIVGLFSNYNEVIVRKETGENKKLSIWYFNDKELLAVEAVNNAKAYVLGTKFIKGRKEINKTNLRDVSLTLSPSNLLLP